MARTLQRRLNLATVITTTTIVIITTGTTSTSVQAAAAGSNRRFSGRLHQHDEQHGQQQRKLGLWGVTAPPLSTATYMTTTLERLRGGDDATSTQVDSDDEEEDDDETEDETEEPVKDSTSTNEDKNGESPEEDKNADNEKDDDDDHNDNPLASVMSMQPLTVTIKTALMGKTAQGTNSVLDQSIELTVNRSRNVASLKQSLSRQLLGRPPVSALRITAPGKGILADDVLVDELMEDEDEEEEDDDDEEGGTRGLVLQLDMVPPVDPKFIPQLERHMEEMTTSELLDAYTANEAAVHCNAALVMRDESNNDDDDENEALAGGTLVSLQLQQQAARMRRDLEAQLLSSQTAQELLQDKLPPHTKQMQQAGLTEIQVRGQRIRKHHPGLAGRGGGVKTTMRLSMQRNLNINWNDSIRYFCVFLFFGFFGGRTPSSKAILLLGAPAVFVLQARPVKLWMKQLLYAFFDQPPGIFLSLLPAPQQAILSLRVGDAMQAVYGPYAGSAGISYDEDEQEEMNEVDDEEMDDFGEEDDDVDILDYDDEEEEEEDYQDDDYDSDEDE
jgi:hypothetical protein